MTIVKPPRNLLIVGGGRDYENRDWVWAVMGWIHARHPITVLRHGACGWDADRPETHHLDKMKGADRFADEWAWRIDGIKVDRCPAHWRKFHGFAGPTRNADMFRDVDKFDQVICMVFPGGKGSLDLCKKAIWKKLKFTGLASIAVTFDKGVKQDPIRMFGPEIDEEL